MDGTFTALLVAAALVFSGLILILRKGRARDRTGTETDGVISELRSQLARTEERLEQAQVRVTELQAERSVAEERAESAQRAAADQRQIWDEASKHLQDTFKAVASDALAGNRDELIKAADRLITDASKRSTIEFETSRSSFEQLISPLRDAVDAYKRESAGLEQLRLQQLGKVEEQYRQLSGAAAELSAETAKLTNALRSPQVRGRWGQMTLKRTAELAGLVDHCDFYEQETVPTEGRRLRPDMLVRLPARRLIVVDAKVPLDAYLQAMNATSESERDAALKQHALQTRDHISQLASKEYQDEFDDTPEFVVAFIPSDSILASAVEKDPELLEFALARSVVVATPSTFFALLRAIAYGWRQEQIAQDAQRVSALARVLAERLGVMVGHFDRVGSALRRAVESYNETIGSLESRVLPAARRFRAHGVTTKTITELHQLEIAPRSVAELAVPEGAQEIFPEEGLPGEDSDLQEAEAAELGLLGGTFTCRCRVCGIAFEATGPNARYCSDDCRDAPHASVVAIEPTARSGAEKVDA